MRSTRRSKPDAPSSPPNTRSRARARNGGTVPTIPGKRRRSENVPDYDSDGVNDSPDNAELDDSDDDDVPSHFRSRSSSRSRSRSRSLSRSRSRSLSVIPTSEMPPLTMPAPDDPAVRALGLSQSARPGAATLTLEYEHLVRMREGHFHQPRPATPPADRERDFRRLSLSEAAWIRLEEVGVINKGRSWTSRVGLDENGDPVKPDLPYVILTKLVIASSPRKMLTLNQIYQAMEERWPYFRMLGQTFRNSIRHNLSMNPAFVNVERPATEGGVGTGKGGYWRVSDDKTTSHRGRAKKPRTNARNTAAKNLGQQAPRYTQHPQQEFYTQQYQYTAQPHLHAPHATPAHALQSLAQGSPHPLPSRSFDRAPDNPVLRRSPRKTAPAVRQPAHETYNEETSHSPAFGQASSAYLATHTPAAYSASSSPMTAPATTHSQLSSPSARAVPATPATAVAASIWSSQRLGASPYTGLTLQPAESFVRGTATLPPKLPTPPSENSSTKAADRGMSALEAFASTALEEERYARAVQDRVGSKLTDLLLPLTPESPGITPPRPA